MTTEAREPRNARCAARAHATTAVAVAVALTLVVATSAQAQATLVLPAPTVIVSSMSRPMARVEAPVATAASDLMHGPATDAKFWLLGAALNTAMLLDTKSTFDVKRRCARCVETNPLVAPFINRGPTVAFVAAEAFDVGVLTLAARMRKADRASVRRLWWVVPVALTIGHAVAYRHNLRVGGD
jgi:hypothetical protein